MSITCQDVPSLDQRDTVAKTRAPGGASVTSEQEQANLRPSERLRDFFDRRAPFRPAEQKRFYNVLLRNYYRFHIPSTKRVIEVGCGVGDLLAAVEPSFGLGLDFSKAAVEIARRRHSNLRFQAVDVEARPNLENEGGRFDYIILSDLVNDLNDVQTVLAGLLAYACPETRLVLNFFNNLWRPMLGLAEKLDLKAPSGCQNWLSATDMQNLLRLSGWELITEVPRILCPIKIPFLSAFLNRFCAPLLSPLCLTIFQIARPNAQISPFRSASAQPFCVESPSCSVIIPARNEEGNIEAAVRRLPEMGRRMEIIFIEGGSVDGTWAAIQKVAREFPERNIRILKQNGRGKGSAVRQGFEVAEGELLFILDADLSVPPEDLPKFYEAARSGLGEFINGVRLVYPMEAQAMQFLNMVANKLFGLSFTWLMGQAVKDTLCGTKVLFRRDYEQIARHRAYFGEFDPFGDFDLLFGAAKLNLKIVDLPIRYAARTYGTTNIQRWRHGLLLLRMVLFAAGRLKFI